jgi:hypothetical protein
MQASFRSSNALGARLRLLALVILAGTALAPQAGAQTPKDSKKFKREIEVMENVLDRTVVDSRNVLVPSRHCVHGVYIPQFGVLFTFQASLLDRGRWWDWDGGWNYRKDGKGRIFIYNDDEDDDDDDSRDSRNDKNRKDEGRSWRDRESTREERKYADAKDELIDTLLDYGDTITGLGPNEWIGICVYLEDSDYFYDHKISRYIVKARMDDLRSYANKGLTHDAMKGKLVKEEY